MGQSDFLYRRSAPLIEEKIDKPWYRGTEGADQTTDHKWRYRSDVASRIETGPAPAGGDQHQYQQDEALADGAVHAHPFADSGGRIAEGFGPEGRVTGLHEFAHSLGFPVMTAGAAAWMWGRTGTFQSTDRLDKISAHKLRAVGPVTLSPL